MGSRRALSGCLMTILVSLAGCASAGTVNLATQPHYKYDRIAGVTRAARDETTLYLAVRTEGADAAQAESVVVQLPLDQLADSVATTSPMPLYSGDGVFYHASSELFRPAGSIPDAAAEVPLEATDLARLPEVTQSFASSGQEILVANVAWNPDPGNVGSSARYVDRHYELPRHLIAVFRPERPEHQRLLLIADFFQRPTRHRAWFALMPISAAVDIVTSPLQFIIFLMMGGFDGC